MRARAIGSTLIALALGTASAAAWADPPPAPRPDAARAAETEKPLTLCLAVAADDSPVYPLKDQPSTYRDMTVAYRVPDDASFETLASTWTIVDLGPSAPKGTVLGKAEVRIEGRKRGSFHFASPKDLPLGTYRLAVAGDGKAWASLDVRVVAPSPFSQPLPASLLPLAKGRTWSYDFTFETGPGASRPITLPRTTKDAEGRLHAVDTTTVVGDDEHGTHLETRRADLRVDDAWWRVGPAGLVSTREEDSGGTVTSFDPPVRWIGLPLASPTTWTDDAKRGADKIEVRAFGPHPVATPTGVAPGWIVLLRTGSGSTVTTIERHFVFGTGIVRESRVTGGHGVLTTRADRILR